MAAVGASKTLTRPTPVRATQSFVGTLSSVWSRPSLVLFELAWRWTFGIPALALVVVEARGILSRATAGTLDPAALGLSQGLMADPVGSLAAGPVAAAEQIADALGRLKPGLAAVGLWLVPLLFCAWVAISGIGRTAVLRRADDGLAARPLSLMGFQALRALAIGAMFAGWLQGVALAGRKAIGEPVAAGAEPNLVLFSAAVIVLSLGLFTLWGFLGWWFSVAPVLAMAHGLSLPGALAEAWRLGPIRGKLVEINLVMGIVKIALIVLAMVFTATPLPFETVISGEFLFWWWCGVMVLYVLASDFFHVARMVGYVQLFRRYEAAASHADRVGSK